MIQKTFLIVACALAAGALVASPQDKYQSKPSKEEAANEFSKIVILGTSVTLEAVGPKGGQLPASLTFQWHKDGQPIAGATKKTYTVAKADKSSVGIYTVKATREDTSKEQKTATYSISTLATNAGGPGQGTLTVPIGDFTSGSMSCCGVTGFDRYRVYVPFDGPNVSTPSASFPNPLNKPKLTVDTLTGNNTTLNTCVMIRQNFSPYTTIACNDDYPTPPGNKLSAATATLATGKQYRSTICYKNSTLGGATTVIWNYLYHD
jgi:hypothetical protein